MGLLYASRILPRVREVYAKKKGVEVDTVVLSRQVESLAEVLLEYINQKLSRFERC